jgi:hypothetical protein
MVSCCKHEPKQVEVQVVSVLESFEKEILNYLLILVGVKFTTYT